MQRPLHILLLILAVTAMAGSCNVAQNEPRTSCAYARYFDICRVGKDSLNAVVAISPYSGHGDTLVLERPLYNIVCMSSSQVAGLAAVGADSVISAVSGIRYVSNPAIRARAEAKGHLEGGRTRVYDIGYESSLDYERILKLNPDIVLTYTVSGAEPQYITRLRSLGVRVLVLHDHLEDHPLARAEYIRMYGALTGRQSLADSLFEEISSRYESLAARSDENSDRVKVLLNVPYGDAWYIPGEESYMSRLIRDAGGEVLGARQGTSISGTVTLEQAYELSQEADIWLNPGPFRTRKELGNAHHAFPMFGPLKNGKPIYNNTLRTTPEGGNDFWESGSVRPDLILEDLIRIFSDHSLDINGNDSLDVIQPESEPALEYHFQVK